MKEYRKRIPYNFFNGILWGIYCIFNGVMLVIVSIQNNENLENYFVLILKIGISGLLLVICIFKYQDYT